MTRCGGCRKWYRDEDVHEFDCPDDDDLPPTLVCGECLSKAFA